MHSLRISDVPVGNDGNRVSDPYQLDEGVNGGPDAEILAAVLPPATYLVAPRVMRTVDMLLD